HNYFIYFFDFSPRNFFADKGVITFFPVFSSICFLVFPAIIPPCFAIFLFSLKFFGFFSLLISVVVASASIFKTSSKLLILSLRLSFLRPLKFLYFLTVNPLHALVISSVRIAYSIPFFTPLSSHSSVSSFLTSILFKRWLIHCLLYPFLR